MRFFFDRRIGPFLMSACLVAVTACGDSEDNEPEPGPCLTYTELHEDITEDTTLDGCYTVTEAINVSGATLTIKADSTLQFEKDTRLTINSGGVIVAKGTAAKPILFTGVSKTRGYWRYVAIAGSAASGNELDRVIIEFGGNDSYDPGNLLVEDKASVAITNSVFRDSAGYGMRIENGAQLTSFASNTLTKNGKGAVSIGSDSAGYLDDASDYSGNDADIVLLTDDGNYNVRRDQTWPGINVPYLLDDSIGIQAHLTIAAGAEIQVKQDQSISVTGSAGGALTAVGTADAPILFTGEQDTRGYWKFLRLVNSDHTDNRFEYVTVEDAGSDGYQPGNFVVEEGSRVTISNCTFRKSSGFGLYLENGAIVDNFAANTMTKNQLGAAQVGSDSAGYLDDTSDYTGNDVDQVLLTDDGNYNVRRDQTWPAINVDYLLDDTINVQAHLTVAAGAVVRVKNDQWISITGSAGGAFSAVGTSDKPILFSRELSSVGNWAGIVFNNTASVDNKLEHVTVEYGGAAVATHPSDVMLEAGTSVEIKNSTFRNSAADGIYLDCGVTVNDLNGSGNTYSGNAALDVHEESC